MKRRRWHLMGPLLIGVGLGMAVQGFGTYVLSDFTRGLITGLIYGLTMGWFVTSLIRDPA